MMKFASPPSSSMYEPVAQYHVDDDDDDFDYFDSDSELGLDPFAGCSDQANVEVNDPCHVKNRWRINSAQSKMLTEEEIG